MGVAIVYSHLLGNVADSRSDVQVAEHCERRKMDDLCHLACTDNTNAESIVGHHEWLLYWVILMLEVLFKYLAERFDVLVVTSCIVEPCYVASSSRCDHGDETVTSRPSCSTVLAHELTYIELLSGRFKLQC
jgi:hypothetical protein